MNTNAKSMNRGLYAALVGGLAVVLAVALPQVCHMAGAWLGVETALGEVLLPMHLPVMLAGLMGGPVAGLLAGIISPLVSYGLTGMPLMTMLPFITIELAVYGLTAGLLRRSAMPVVCKVLVIQVAGRAVRALALVMAHYVFSVTAPPLSVIWTSISAGMVGILLQMVLIPLMMRGMKQWRT